MEANLVLVLEHLEPGETVRVRPDGVVDTCEVDVKLRPLLFEEVREQHRHLVVRQRVFLGPQQLVPTAVRWWHVPVLWFEFDPSRRRHTTFRANGAGEDMEELECSGALPTVEVAGTNGSPGMGRERMARGCDVTSDRFDLTRLKSTLCGRPLRRVSGILLLEDLHELSIRLGPFRVTLRKGVLPVDPPFHELMVDRIPFEQ